MKKGIASFVVAAIIAIVVYGSALAQSGTGTVIRGANIRSGPGVTYKIVGAAKAGDVVTIVGLNKERTWTKIGAEKWVASYLVKVDAVAPVPTPTPVWKGRADMIIESFVLPAGMTANNDVSLKDSFSGLDAISFADVSFSSPSGMELGYIMVISFADQDTLAVGAVSAMSVIHSNEACAVVDVPRYAAYGCVLFGSNLSAFVFEHVGNDLVISTRTGTLADFSDNAADAILDMDQIVEIAKGISQ